MTTSSSTVNWTMDSQGNWTNHNGVTRTHNVENARLLQYRRSRALSAVVVRTLVLNGIGALVSAIGAFAVFCYWLRTDEGINPLGYRAIYLVICFLPLSFVWILGAEAVMILKRVASLKRRLK